MGHRTNKNLTGERYVDLTVLIGSAERHCLLVSWMIELIGDVHTSPCDMHDQSLSIITSKKITMFGDTTY